MMYKVGRWHSQSIPSRRRKTPNKKPRPFRKVGRGVSILTPKKKIAIDESTTLQPIPVVREEVPAPSGSMMCWEESRKKISVPTALLLAKTNIIVGAWSIKTMYEAGKAVHAPLQHQSDWIK
jgi:hypothetical protein